MVSSLFYQRTLFVIGHRSFLNGCGGEGLPPQPKRLKFQPNDPSSSTFPHAAPRASSCRRGCQPSRSFPPPCGKKQSAVAQEIPPALIGRHTTGYKKP